MDQSTISMTLREAIRRDGRSAQALAIASGVNQAMITRFLNETRTLRLPAVDKLATELGLVLRPARRPKGA